MGLPTYIILYIYLLFYGISLTVCDRSRVTPPDNSFSFFYINLSPCGMYRRLSDERSTNHVDNESHVLDFDIGDKTTSRLSSYDIDTINVYWIHMNTIYSII